MLATVLFIFMAMAAVIFLPIFMSIAIAIVWLLGMGFTFQVIDKSSQGSFLYAVGCLDEEIQCLAIVLWPVTWIVAIGALLASFVIQ